jgi:hypothetical protein
VLGTQAAMELGAQSIKMRNERFTVPEVIFSPGDIGIN